MIKRMKFLLVLPLLMAGLVTTAPEAYAETVRIEGSPHALNIFVVPRQRFLETMTKTKIVAQATTTTDGLQALVENKTDMVFIVGNLSTFEPILKRVNPHASLGDYSVYLLPETADLGGTTEDRVYYKCYVVVSVSNPVKTLTPAQAHDIFTGKITNWSAVGGNDKPIRVLTEPRGTAARLSIEDFFLDGASFTPKAKEIADITWHPTLVEDGDISIAALTSLAALSDSPDSQPPKPDAPPPALGQAPKRGASIGPVKPVMKSDEALILPIEIIVKGKPTVAQAKIISLLHGVLWQ